MSQFHYVSRFSSSTGQNFGRGGPGGSFFFLFIHSLSPLLKIPSTIQQRRIHRGSDHHVMLTTQHLQRPVIFSTIEATQHTAGAQIHPDQDHIPPLRQITPPLRLSCPNPVILTCTVPSLKKKKPTPPPKSTQLQLPGLIIHSSSMWRCGSVGRGRAKVVVRLEILAANAPLD